MQPASTPHLADYLRLRGEGCGIATAAEESGLPVDEAWEAEAAVQRGELKFTRGENDMPKHDQVEEILQPDFELMKRIFDHDLKPANEQNAKSRGELSVAWGEIEKTAHINKRAAKLLFRLRGESEEMRDDFLRSLYGGMKALGIAISKDLVDRMTDSDAPEMPTETGKGLGAENLATVQ